MCSPPGVYRGGRVDGCESRRRLGEYLGVLPDEVHFGASTSQNTYVLAQAVRSMLEPERRGSLSPTRITRPTPAPGGASRGRASW